MNSASPSGLVLETSSAWVVILVVSLVTLAAALLIRKFLTRPGGIASGLLLAVPLLLPLVAALAFAQGLLPEFAVLRPARADTLSSASELSHLLLFLDRDSQMLVPYALSGSVGPWILVIGLSVSSFMLIRRLVGTVLVRRMVAHSRPLENDVERGLQLTVARLCAGEGIKRPPEVLILPPGISGAFAVGSRRRQRILVSADLPTELEPEELEGILAHEVAHLDARDVQVVWSAGVLRDMMAWNPLAHFAYRRLVTDRELEADRRAAAMTGDPLAVASGLVKMCELMRSRKRYGYRTALAFLKPRSRITQRVSTMIAVADGRISAGRANSFPYLFAALMVAVLGLQAGASMASSGGEAYAFLWGGPSDTSNVWRPAPPKVAKADKAAQAPGRSRGSDKRHPKDSLSLGYKATQPVAVKERDLVAWLRSLRRGAPAGVLRFEKLHNWNVKPLLAGEGMGFYRIEATKLKALTR